MKTVSLRRRAMRSSASTYSYARRLYTERSHGSSRIGKSRIASLTSFLRIALHHVSPKSEACLHAEQPQHEPGVIRKRPRIGRAQVGIHEPRVSKADVDKALAEQTVGEDDEVPGRV